MRNAPTIVQRPRGRRGVNAARAALAVVIATVLTLVVMAFLAPSAALAGRVADASRSAEPVLDQAEPVVGQSEPFWVRDWDEGADVLIQATARYVGQHAAVYVDNEAHLSQFLVDELGASFDTVIYPALTAAFGSEPNRGIDGDPRVVILIYDFNDGSHAVEGAFDYRDIDPASDPGGGVTSNRREMFYLNLAAILAEPDNAGALAAHEFTHLIVYYRDVMLDPAPDRTEEDLWITEGFTTYGEHLAGYNGRTNGQLRSFMNAPNFNLTYWQGVRANYGASYSFMRYLADREGPEFIRALVEQPLDGEAGIDATLAALDSSDTFASLFDDWVLAGFLDGRPPALWPYMFSTLTVAAQPTSLGGVEPVLGSALVENYGAVYLDFAALSAGATFQAVVDGADGAPLEAALISWDSAAVLPPVVARFNLDNPAVGDTMTVPVERDRHTLAVWARGTVGSDESFGFRYSGAHDPPGGVQFLDMGGTDPFYRYAAVLLERGIINGREVSLGSGLWFFCGQENLTRAQFAKMIMLATGLHTEEMDNLEASTFLDVSPALDQSGRPLAYPYDFIEEAAALGIVKGYEDGTFGPYKPVTRAQLVLMIIRGASAAGKPLPAYTGGARVFADVPVSHPYYREIMTAYGAGIVDGAWGTDGRRYFYPYSSASRNHVAKMTANLIDRL